MSFRGFIAIDVEAGEWRKFEESLRTLGSAVRILAPEIIHFTLKFLGDTPEDAQESILQALREACQGEASFPIRLQGVGVFPSPAKPSVVWIGGAEDGSLSRITGRLEENLAGIGFPQENRPFTPHLTIARVKGPVNPSRLQGILTEFSAASFGTVLVRSVRLKRSVLGAGGPTYSTVGEITLP